MQTAHKSYFLPQRRQGLLRWKDQQIKAV